MRRIRFLGAFVACLCYLHGVALGLNLDSIAAFGINGEMTRSTANFLLKSQGFTSSSKSFPSIGNGTEIEYRRGQNRIVLITSNQAILEISSSQVDIGRCRVSSGETEKQLTRKLGRPNRTERKPDGSLMLIYKDIQAGRAIDIKIKDGRVACVIFGGT